MGAEKQATTCTACDAGKFSAEKQATTCTACDAGTYSGGGKAFCNACPVGTWSATTLLTRVDDCIHCQAGKSTIGEKNIAYSACYDCAAGNFSTEGGACTKCLAGEYSSQPGKSKCKVCPEGRYSSSPGQSKCTEIEDGHVCKPLDYVKPFVSGPELAKHGDKYDLYVTLRGAAENVYILPDTSWIDNLVRIVVPEERKKNY